MTQAPSPSEPPLSHVVVDDDADFHRTRSPSQRRRVGPWAIALIAAAAAAVALLYWWRQQDVAPPAAPPVAATPPAPSAQSEPAVRHPIEDVPKHAGLSPPAEPAAAMPSLADSDPTLRDSLGAIASGFERFVHPQDIARRFVATVDNLPRASIAPQVMAAKPVTGAFAVTGAEGRLAIAPDNAARYTPYVRFATSLDTTQLVALYVRFYPWFQQAYVDLGYPSGHFNDRLVQVIDDLLAAPEPKEPVALVQPRVLYQFADPRLEALPAGQKMMLRMGSENAAQVKAKLRELRRALTGALPPS
jgi:hypothetical protein